MKDLLEMFNIAKKGDVIGEFSGHPIYRWISLDDGRVFDYSHVSDSKVIEELLSGKFITMFPGIVYKVKS